MQILQPLTVGDVGFASGHILHVTRVDQENSETLLLQDLKQGNPVHPRRFHRYGLDVAAVQPGRSSLQVFCEGREMSYRLLITIWGHGDVDLAALSFSRHG